MDKETLRSIIIDQKELMENKLKRETIIKREGLSACQKYISQPNVLLISGLRRAGKSIFSHLLARSRKYGYINFDDERLIGADTDDLNQILECFYELFPDFALLVLDEIQNIAGWELFVNRLRQQYPVIVTGSNANLLSSELATHLTGRFVAFSLFPLDFKEFLKFNAVELKEPKALSSKQKSKVTALFTRYLKEGGIFEHYQFGEEFMRNLFSSIITKDIVARYEIKHPSALEELALLLVNYFTSKISLNNLTKSLKIKSSHTTKEYLKYLENTFLLFTINKFSFKIKEQLSTFKKLYVIDNGIINSLILDFSHNKGKLLENLVAIELKKQSSRHNFKVYYWDNYNVECDFIIKQGTKITKAYQVCWEINQQNKTREIAGLTAALREFKLKEGVILTGEAKEAEIKVANFKIKTIPVWKWLLQPDFNARDF